MPVPRKNESKKDFISRCIPFVIDEGTTDDSKQAAAICNGIWKKHEEADKIGEKILFTMNAKLLSHINLEKNNRVELDKVSMIVGDNYFNGIYFPKEELERIYHQFEGVPINLNHSDDKVEDIVGYLKDVHYENYTIKATPVFDENTAKYKEAMGFIESRLNAGGIPNVSVGMYGERFEEELNDDGDTHWVARNLDADHLALVVHGACNPATGCGIGLSKEKDNTSVSVVDEDYTSKKELYKKLEKEIIMEKIKEEELKNVRKDY